MQKLKKVATDDASTYRRPTSCHRQGKIFRGFESELQTNPMPFHLDWLCGATLMPLRAYAMDVGRNTILRVDKNLGPILSRLCAKLHEILG